MSLRPRIDRPCPALANLNAAMDGSFCRLCSKTVHDLDAMTATQRCGLLGEARDEVCVRYRLPAALAAVALATAALPAAAQTGLAPPTPTQAAPADNQSGMEIIVGGIGPPTAAEQRQLRLEAREEQRRERDAAKAPARADRGK